MTLVSEILNLNLEKILNYENINNEINCEVEINGFVTNPIITAVSVYKENNEISRKIIEYLLSFDELNVSKVFIIKGTNGLSDTIYTLFHLISEIKLPLDLCELILNSKSLNKESLNVINEDDYRPLDLAYEYNKDITKLLESKGAKRYFRFGPGFKVDDSLKTP